MPYRGRCYNHYVAKKLLNSGTYALGGKEHDAKKIPGGPLQRSPSAGTFWPPAKLSQISTFSNVAILYTNRREILR